MPIQQGGVVFFDGSRIIVLGSVTSGVRPPFRIVSVRVIRKREAAIKNRDRRYWRAEYWSCRAEGRPLRVHRENLDLSDEGSEEQEDQGSKEECDQGQRGGGGSGQRGGV
uniref:Uncharacterized protein n=1 Tax=Coccolithus braarudii TaxID=221442 RepID=A0A7S0LPZ7_9EUKA|mmetsp:Transcript_49498/g.105682  ORF Transcript_49498/g.105682 Transcript_49498/m.105682 type:complete len:110 (+) Transcript_49498:220-549(+)